MFKDKEAFKSELKEEALRVHGRPLERCGTYEKYEALVSLITDEAATLRAATNRRNVEKEKKTVYYFSMEFLVGRLLKNYLLNLGVLDIVQNGLQELGLRLDELCECEQDPGLGNGGLGRLAACFLDSMAAMDIDAMGMGVRYRYGLFRQVIYNGWQREEPDAWLDNGYPWEDMKPEEAVDVRFGGTVDRYVENGVEHFTHNNYNSIRAMPYDVPIVGYGGKRVNMLRLWQAQPVRETVDLAAFNRGEYSEALRTRNEAEAITCILYPDDSTEAGKELRLKQEYFFVSAGVQTVIRRYKRRYGAEELPRLPERVSIHTNDTHPTLCVPELMRILMDEEGMEWEPAWEIVRRTISYTNHTVLPEALEKWPIQMFSRLLPRIYMITAEIDRRYREGFDRTRPDAEDLLARTAVLWDGQVRMANLNIIGGHSVNGVAALHTEILKKDTLQAFYTLQPELFNNKTNGVSHRRFLAESNRGLAGLITEAIGDRWLTDMNALEDLLPLCTDAPFLDRLNRVKYDNKCELARYIARQNHIWVDPNSIFDVQVKRIHAYKRQHLNVLKIMDLYNRLREDPALDVPPTTFIFAGKAAQSYVFAKEMIKFICSIADKINADPLMDGKLKVVFLENFSVSSGQVIYPAADVSEQISTAGKEASGTGNMKFMMNGALTLGTLDGANVEIRNLVGDDNIFIFGQTAEEAMEIYRNGGYDARAVAEADASLRQISAQLTNGFFRDSGWDFHGIADALLNRNDEYFVLKDFRPYVDAWEALGRLYLDRRAWNEKSLVNIAKSGYFSSDRTIREYADEIWRV